MILTKPRNIYFIYVDVKKLIESFELQKTID